MTTWTWRSLPLLLVVLAAATPADAETPRGSYFYVGLAQCIADQKLDENLCANAAANAEAEFDEKAPRFSTRQECDARFGPGKCELGLRGANGWSGKRGGVFFMPRQSGFRVTVHSQSDMTVLPSFSGRELGFAPRTILRLQTSRSGSMRREAGQRPNRGGAAAFGQPMGAETAGGPAGPLPPVPKLDPNFDCAALLEPSTDQPASSGCYPVPPGRLRR
jgi:uncharacterized protein YgiB involved in biofilm formation